MTIMGHALKFRATKRSSLAYAVTSGSSPTRVCFNRRAPSSPHSFMKGR